MKFREDLIKGFVEENGCLIANMHSYLSGVGCTVTVVEAVRDHRFANKWTFVDFNKLERVGVNCDEKVDKELFKSWQKYVLRHTKGCQFDSLLRGFIDLNKKNLFSSIENLVDDSEKIDEYVLGSYISDEELEHLLYLEELRFKDNLEDVKRRTYRFPSLFEGIQEFKAEYMANISKEQNRLLQKVNTSVSEKGEAVYEFSESQYCVYEKLKDIKETIDFAFRHQIYRADLEEDKEAFNQNS